MMREKINNGEIKIKSELAADMAEAKESYLKERPADILIRPGNAVKVSYLQGNIGRDLEYVDKEGKPLSFEGATLPNFIKNLDHFAIFGSYLARLQGLKFKVEIEHNPSGPSCLVGKFIE